MIYDGVSTIVWRSSAEEGQTASFEMAADGTDSIQARTVLERVCAQMRHSPVCTLRVVCLASHLPSSNSGGHSNEAVHSWSVVIGRQPLRLRLVEPVLYYRRRDEATSGANAPASLGFVKTKRIGTRSCDQGGMAKAKYSRLSYNAYAYDVDSA